MAAMELVCAPRCSLSFSSLYAHYLQFSLQGWRLAFLLARCSLHLLVAISMLLASLFLFVFIARELVRVSEQALRQCASVGAALLGLANDSHVGTAVVAWTKVLSSGELSSMQ